MYKHCISRLHLTNYRNFENLQISAPLEGVVLLIGDNGQGKTNVLEALSMLSPGRGLRNAKFEELCRHSSDNWRIHAMTQSKIGVAEIDSFYSAATNKRQIHYNGSVIGNTELAKLFNIVWTTPQIEGIFLSGLTERRRFFDRIVYNFMPSHASTVNKYEHYLKERMQILEQDTADAQWLAIVENKIAEQGVEIASNRVAVLQQMQQAIGSLDSLFPKAILRMEGEVENLLIKGQGSEVAAEYLRQESKGHRARDKAAGRTLFGVHRSEFLATHAGKNQLAKFCSTGEQKAMLISILLAQVKAIIDNTANYPILLLDEIFVHLDDMRKHYLGDFFLNVGAQVWVTATDLHGIEEIASKSQVVMI